MEIGVSHIQSVLKLKMTVQFVAYSTDLDVDAVDSDDKF